MNGLPLLPAIAVEFFGSALAILFSFFALRYAWALVRLQPNNFIWGFLFYFCIAMAAFSLSRGVGHMVRVILVYTANGDIWQRLSLETVISGIRRLQYHADDLCCCSNYLLSQRTCRV